MYKNVLNSAKNLPKNNYETEKKMTKRQSSKYLVLISNYSQENEKWPLANMIAMVFFSINNPVYNIGWYAVNQHNGCFFDNFSKPL